MTVHVTKRGNFILRSDTNKAQTLATGASALFERGGDRGRPDRKSRGKRGKVGRGLVELDLLTPITMSRPMNSMNMLRTRRKDNNVKPNRRDARLARLDRKSSRGMLYENEELRLKTININAEVESIFPKPPDHTEQKMIEDPNNNVYVTKFIYMYRMLNGNIRCVLGQSDIKKLKRENEMLKKGLWYLRDEYDKLEKLIKDKKIDFSSSSTTCSSSSSESESCSSCEESGEVETTQNIKNVQRTNLKNMQDQFDHLSVVTEETSAENSEQNSNRASLPNENWNHFEKDVIKPDQSYPIYENVKSQTLPVQEKVPANFFAPIKTSRSLDDDHFNQQTPTIYPGDFYDNSMVARDSVGNNFDDNLPDPNGHSPMNSIGTFQQFDQNCDNYLSQKIVQTNARNFYQNMVLVPKTTKPQPEAKAMEKSSTDLIVKIDNKNFNNNALIFSNTPSQSTFSNGGNLEELLNDIESISQVRNDDMIEEPTIRISRTGAGCINTRGRNLITAKREDQFTDHFINDNSQTVPDMEKPYKSELNVVLMPNPMPLIGFDKYRNIQMSMESLDSKPIEELSASQQNLYVIPPPPIDTNGPNGHPQPPPPPPPSLFLEENGVRRACEEDESNPFFFGELERQLHKNDQKSGSKANLLDLTSSEHVSSENEENLKFKTTKPDKVDEKTQQKADPTHQEVKSPKLSIRRKVSIHFKGKKEKNKKVSLDTNSDPSKPKTPNEKKHSLFDIRFSDKEKNKAHQKTPSIESKKSTTETSNQEPKTPTSTDSKISNEKRTIGIGEKKEGGEKKIRKSQSVSPERSKHVHLKDEGAKKHKKHKRGDRSRMRRPSVAVEPRNLRERSYSVCTDRSNILEHRLGLGLGFGSSFLYDDYSDRERTNSMSSCETGENVRKLSSMSNVPLSGKVPWCGCWGNGCL
ncbi:hypothetical protein NQ317_012264 [Molorchus minor]|uniref:Uncharacterized protein n=1 Tax=Molorchus minor TaxID=1323400 RepID=A0ABQ9K0B4_9CUCU|nr:hypothetical protein NQ317_012264 [Molorchus minor]